MASVELSAFTRKKVEQLGLDPETTEVLVQIQAEIANAYREDFIELRHVVARQSSALERIQNTLATIVKHLGAGQGPPVLRMAGPGEEADLASVLADPIGAGFTLTQADLARALSVSATDVSILVTALGLKDDERYAMVVRRGKRGDLVNFHSTAPDHFVNLVRAAPPLSDGNQNSALSRVKRKLEV